jgi:hypothetical protein
MDVQLVSCLTLPEPDRDEAPLLAALGRAGIEARVAAWDDPRVDWSLGRLALLRSCWNYPQHAEAFLRWAESVSAATELWNPLPIVRWNVHKRYLLDLEQRGVSIVPTRLLARGDGTSLHDVTERAGAGPPSSSSPRSPRPPSARCASPRKSARPESGTCAHSPGGAMS